MSCGERHHDRRSPLPHLPPVCDQCGGMLRPGVVWFGESLPQDVWARAERAVQAAQIFLIAGTSAHVYPAAGLAGLAKHSGATIVEVNVEESGVTSLADYVLRGPSGEILPQLLPIKRAGDC